MTAYLRANPPARSQFRSPRREQPSGSIILHTAENTPDTVATDGGAEAVARFIRDRAEAGSYHDLCDSDSTVHLVDWADEAFHVGTHRTNHHALSVSAATTAAWWPWAPTAWRDGCVEQMAQAANRQAKWVKATTGVVVPAKRISIDDVIARRPGFCTHAELDPTRRSDPGPAFPWQQFLARFAQLTRQTTNSAPPPSEEDDDMALTVHIREEFENVYELAGQDIKSPEVQRHITRWVLAVHEDGDLTGHLEWCWATIGGRVKPLPG